MSAGHIAHISTNLQLRFVEPGWIRISSTTDSLLDWLQIPASGQSLPELISDAMKNGRKLPLSECLNSFGTDKFHWDALTLAAELIEHDKPGVSPLLDARAVSEMAERWSAQGQQIQLSFKRACYG